MAILRLNAAERGDVFVADGGDWRAALNARLAETPDRAPVTILIHGLRYSWRYGSRADPHRSLYRADATPNDPAFTTPVRSWPVALGFANNHPDRGLCIAFGWHPGGIGAIRQAHRTVDRFAPGLIAVVDAVAATGRRADCFAHSLGAALLLNAIRLRPGLAIRRAILLGPAERRGRALEALDAQASSGAGTEFLHILARANDVFDEVFNRLVPPDATGCAAPLGVAGLQAIREEWLDLQIDHPESRAWLRSRRNAQLRPAAQISHWLYYRDPAAMALYRDVLRDEATSCLATLRSLGVPGVIAPRWSGLIPSFGKGRSDTARRFLDCAGRFARSRASVRAPSEIADL